MSVHICVTVEDLDKQTVKVEDEKVVSPLEDTNTVTFTGKEVTVGDFLLQSGEVVKLVFREIDQSANKSNRIAVCTGFQYQGGGR